MSHRTRPSSSSSIFSSTSALPHSTLRLPGTKNGFTLVEVTLATVVISLGLLALFGLGRLALRNAQTLEDETRSAMLAEDIFASIRTVSETLCASNNPGVWAEFWCAFRDGQTPLPLQLSTATSFQNRNNSDVWGNGSICTNDLWSRPGIHGTTNSMPEWRARYRLVIDDPTGGTNLFKVQLYITPGLAGPFDESRPILGLFAEHGTLP